MPLQFPPTLYLNENIDIRLVDLLSSRGVRAIHTIHAGNQSVSDEFQLKYAAENNYVVLTHNRWDFRKLHEAWLKRGRRHSGIIVIGNGEPEVLAVRIQRFLQEKYPHLQPSFCESPPA